MGSTAASHDAPELSVVIACYMEEGHLAASVRELAATLDGMGRSYELIFVEDKSTDGTASVVAELVAGRPERRAVYHATNQGRGATVAEGFRLARGRVVGFLDIDLEVHCRHLPMVLAAIDQGADGATAFRHYSPGTSANGWMRKALSRSYRWLFRRCFETPFDDPETGFKFFVRERILQVIDEAQDRHWFWDSEVMVLAHLHGLRVVEVPCFFERRDGKASTVKLLRDIWRYFVAIRGFRARLRERAERTTATA
jgi:glycosyltransferase involved in cell wall biosynthesis